MRLERGTPVIVISIDTLRADHLPAYGYTGVRTPHFDAFRRDAILFRHAYSNCPLTLPSHVSAFTGLLPPEHGVRNNIGFRFDGEKHQSLASLLKSSGYVTGAAVSSYVLRGSTGISRGFDFYEDAIASRHGAAVSQLQRSGIVTTSIAQRWIDQNSSRPFFFFLHLFEPHYPYEPPAHLAELYPFAYDGEIAYADAIVGQFLGYLKERKLYDRSLIVVMSDHGEGLNDHGEQEHGIFLYREALQVPLMLKLPGARRAGQTITKPVQLIDVFPTIVELMGVKAPRRAHAESLLHAGKPRKIFSETAFPRIHLGWSELQSLLDDRYHFIQAPRVELYDLVADPAERSNLALEQRRVSSSMRQEIESFSRPLETPLNLDREESARLAALGYVGALQPSSSGGALPDPKDRVSEINQIIEATRLHAHKKHKRAIATYRAMLEKNPELADAWIRMALVMEEIGQYSEAAEAYREVMRRSPALAGEVALSLASVLLKLERLDEAEQHARFALQSNPAAARLLLGRVALAGGKISNAEEQARAVSADAHHRFAGMILLAEVRVRQNRLNEALSTVELAAAEARRSRAGGIESLELTRGDVLARLNRLEDARLAFQEEIRLFPHNLLAYANLAVVYGLEGKNHRMMETLEQMAAVNPTSRAHELAARTLEALQQPGRAAQWRERASLR